MHNFNKKQFVIQNTYLFLAPLIFEKNNKEKIEEKITELKSKIPLHKNWCRKIVINEMIRFKKNLKGESSPIIIALYKKLELHFYSARLVADLRYYQKWEIIKEQKNKELTENYNFNIENYIFCKISFRIFDKTKIILIPEQKVPAWREIKNKKPMLMVDEIVLLQK